MASPPSFFDTFNPEAIVPLALKKFDLDMKAKQLGILADKHNMEVEASARKLAQEQEWSNFMNPPPMEIVENGQINRVPIKRTPIEVMEGALARGRVKPEEYFKAITEKPEKFGASAGRVYSTTTGQVVSEKPEGPVDETKGMTTSQKLRKRLIDIGESGTIGPPEEAEIEGINRELAKIEGEKATPTKVQSMGNAVDLAINQKFQDPAYLTDPEKQKKALTWLATPEGKKAVADAAAIVSPPSMTLVPTSGGLVPFTTRGPGAGTVGEPTGLGKPISSEQASKLGDLESSKRALGEAMKLYKSAWVGPIAGRTGAVEEKFLGTASKDQVKFYSWVRDIQDSLLRARSGAQINEQEYQRLANFLPDPNLPSKSFEARAERFKQELDIVMEEKRKALSEAGYGVKKPEVKVGIEERKSIGGKNYIKKNGKWYEE